MLRKARTCLHGLSRVFFEFLDIFFNEDHLLLQEGRLLLQDLQLPEDPRHVLEGLVARFCRGTERDSEATTATTLV